MRTTGVDWPSVIQRQQESALSQREYCVKHRLALSTFTYWKRKLRMSSKALQLLKPQFIEVALPSPELPSLPPEEIVVELPYGVVMRFRGLGR